MWQDLGAAMCLVLVIEGIIPFLYPKRWRELVTQLAEVDDSVVRIIGLLSMVLGAALLYLIK